MTTMGKRPLRKPWGTLPEDLPGRSSPAPAWAGPADRSGAAHRATPDVVSREPLSGNRSDSPAARELVRAGGGSLRGPPAAGREGARGAGGGGPRGRSRRCESDGGIDRGLAGGVGLRRGGGRG